MPDRSARPVGVDFVTYEYPPHIEGGAGTYAATLPAYLAQLGVEVNVISPDWGMQRSPVTRATPRHEPVRFVRAPFCRLASFSLSAGARLSTLNRWKAGRTHIMHSNQFADVAISRRATPEVGRVVSVHSAVDSVQSAESMTLARRILSLGEHSPLARHMERIVLSRADAIVANSQYTRDVLGSRYPQLRDRMHVVYHGISVPGRESFAEVRARYRSDENHATLLFVGRIVPRKGLHLLLRAVALLIGTGCLCRLEVAGDGGDRPAMERLAQALGIRERIVFHGFIDRDQLAQLYCRARIVAVPSLNEPFGYVVPEALAHGTPVVGFRSGALPELIQCDCDGQLTDDVSADALAAVLRQALSRCDSAEDGLRRRDRAEARFSWRRAAVDTLSVYRVATQERRVI